jgi:hypothetical protein
MSPKTVMIPLKRPWVKCGSSSVYRAWAISRMAYWPTDRQPSCLQPWQTHSDSSGMLGSPKQPRWNPCWQLSHMTMVSGLACDPQAMQAVSGSIAGPVASDILTAWAAAAAAGPPQDLLAMTVDSRKCCTALCNAHICDGASATHRICLL